MQENISYSGSSVKKLKKGGYIKKHISPEDGRFKLITLTLRGEIIERGTHEELLELGGRY